MSQRFNFGEIWTANLNPQSGTEPGKTRPVLIVQDQTLLDAKHPSTIIIPLTTNLIDNTEPLRIRIKAEGRLEKDSDLLIDQIRAIDNQRLNTGPLTLCDTDFMGKVLRSVFEVMGGTYQL